MPIRSVYVLNPFSEKDITDDKFSVLDLRAKDDSGRLINIEMQIFVPKKFHGRVLYYWATQFRSQLREGDSNAQLLPKISICLVNEPLFCDVDDYHLAFELTDAVHGQQFSDLMQLRIIQMSKFDRDLAELQDDLEIWMCFFRHIQDLEIDNLPSPLNQGIFLRATKVLELLTKDEQERMRYDARQMAMRDQLSREENAREQGAPIGTIHTCERAIGRQQTPGDDLLQLSLEELSRQAKELDKKLQEKLSGN